MDHTRPTLLAVSALSIVLATGCAQKRSDGLAGEQDPCYLNASVTQLNTAHEQDFVIGTDLTIDGLPVYPAPANTLTLAQIAEELAEMHDRDRTLVRDAIDPDLQTREHFDRISAIDAIHTERLKEIVDYIGWPTRGTVGLEGTEGAYLVIQHSGHDTAFQSRCLVMMHDLADRGELPAQYVALLTDRIRVFNNQPQLYGTQMTLAKDAQGIMRPVPSTEIEYPDELDARRASMGMPPHGAFVDAIAQAYAASLIEPNSRFASAPTE